MYLILSKTNNTDDNTDNYTDDEYVFQKDNYTIFSEDADHLNSLFGYSLDELGYKVTTGEYMWNYNKDKLTDDSSKGVPFIYADNITEDGLQLNKNTKNNNSDKKQFIIDDSVNTEDSIVVMLVMAIIQRLKRH